MSSWILSPKKLTKLIYFFVWTWILCLPQTVLTTCAVGQRVDLCGVLWSTRTKGIVVHREIVAQYPFADRDEYDDEQFDKGDGTMLTWKRRTNLRWHPHCRPKRKVRASDCHATSKPPPAGLARRFCDFDAHRWLIHQAPGGPARCGCSPMSMHCRQRFVTPTWPYLYGSREDGRARRR